MDKPKDDRSGSSELSELTLSTGDASVHIRTIGPYRLLQLLGEGGMGEVWLAEQAEPIHRTVALKLIKAGMDTKAVVARFESERQALAMMDHPNIAKVFDAGSTSTGRPFFVMEYVPGIPINQYCDKHRMTMKERLQLFTQVCEGVQHAHQRAIIHRDLKPSNVLVHQLDDRAVPKIIDFGLAKATARRLTERTMFTELGAVVGTPEYMSPEQTDLTEHNIDTRTDVYSLGVILYELLTGALPFEVKDLRAAGLEAILRRIREDEPTPPSTKIRSLGETCKISAARRREDPHSFARHLRGELDWITMKALEKERSRRYGSPSELAADIQRHLRDQPVLAGAPSTAYRAKKFIRRHRFEVSAATIIVLMLVGFATTVVLQARRIATERDRANQEAKASKRVSDFMTNMFQVSNPSEAKGNQVTAREILDKASKDIETDLAQDPEVQARLMYTMSETYQGLGLLPQAHTLAEHALGIRRRVLGPEDKKTLEAMINVANVSYEEGHYAQAEQSFRELFESYRRLSGPESRDTLGMMANLSAALEAQSRYREAEKVQRDLLDVRRRVLGSEHKDVLDSMALLANTLSGEGHNTEAEKLLDDELGIQLRTLGTAHPGTLLTMGNLASVLEAEHRYSEAREMYQRTLEIQRRVLGDEHPFTLDSIGGMASISKAEGNYKDAEQLFRKILDVRRRVLGPAHPETLSGMGALGITLAYEKRYAEAEKVFREATDLAVKSKAEDLVFTAWHDFACGAAIASHRDEAIKYLREAINHGYSDGNKLMADPDLKSIRDDSRFKALVEEARKQQIR